MQITSFSNVPRQKHLFYEIEDITRDLDFSLKDHIRFGQKMPLVLLTDNGSTEEDEPAYKIASVYDIPFVVIDHHHPDATIDRYLKAHVNPYHVGGDFGITAGMLGTEVARLINPKVESVIRHLPVAAVGDRSEAEERAPSSLLLSVTSILKQHARILPLHWTTSSSGSGSMTGGKL